MTRFSEGLVHFSLILKNNLCSSSKVYKCVVSSGPYFPIFGQNMKIHGKIVGNKANGRFL